MRKQHPGPLLAIAILTMGASVPFESANAQTSTDVTPSACPDAPIVMLEHPGVICYHVDYPSEGVSQWTEIYATDEAFANPQR